MWTIRLLSKNLIPLAPPYHALPYREITPITQTFYGYFLDNSVVKRCTSEISIAYLRIIRIIILMITRSIHNFSFSLYHKVS